MHLRLGWYTSGKMMYTARMIPSSSEHKNYHSYRKYVYLLDSQRRIWTGYIDKTCFHYKLKKYYKILLHKGKHWTHVLPQPQTDIHMKLETFLKDQKQNTASLRVELTAAQEHQFCFILHWREDQSVTSMQTTFSSFCITNVLHVVT